MQNQNPVIDDLLAAALLHVTFDGWSDTTFKAAADDVGVDISLARSLCPRGAVDLAIAFHKAGDAAMVERLSTEGLTDLRFRDKIAAAVRFRLEAVDDKDLVRRGSALFSLPQYAADGAKLIWGTADAIWTTLGDSSDDVNWYTKRATLSAVYGSTVLFWLGDETPGDTAAWAFLDRRIDDVMQFEKFKATMQKNPLINRMFEATLGRVRAPSARPMQDVPGQWADDVKETP